MDSNMEHNTQSNQQGFEIASFVLGIASIVISLSIFDIRYMFIKMIVGSTCAVIGLIIGIASNKDKRNSMATAGIVLSCIGLVIFSVSFVACSTCALVGCASLSLLF